MCDVTVDQNVSKSKFGFEVLLLHLIEKIDGSYEVTVIIVQFNESGMVNSD